MAKQLLRYAFVRVAQQPEPLALENAISGMVILRGDARVFVGRLAVMAAKSVKASQFVEDMVPVAQVGGQSVTLVDGVDYADLEGWSAVRMERKPRNKPNVQDEVYNAICGVREGTVLGIDYTEGTRLDKSSGRTVTSQTVMGVRVLAHPKHVSLTPEELLAQLDHAPDQLDLVAVSQAFYVPQAVDVFPLEDEEAEPLAEVRQGGRGRRTPPACAGDGELFPAGAEVPAEVGGGEG